MKERDVTRHAQEVVTGDIDRIREDSKELIEKSELWRFSGRIEYYVHYGDGDFYGSESTPTPGLKLLEIMYARLTEKRRSTQHIARFINRKLFTLARLAPEQPNHEVGLADDSRDTCRQAETYFYSVLGQLETGYADDHWKVGVYHDDHGEPLLLRKKVAESTALTLVPLALSNMVVPPGTIVSVDNKANRHQSGQAEHDNFLIESYQPGSDLRINPLRLSAWAYDEPLDRGLFATSGQALRHSTEASEKLFYSASKAKMLERTTLQDFVAAAELALEQCTE